MRHLDNIWYTSFVIHDVLELHFVTLTERILCSDLSPRSPSITRERNRKEDR